MAWRDACVARGLSYFPVGFCAVCRAPVSTFVGDAVSPRSRDLSRSGWPISWSSHASLNGSTTTRSVTSGWGYSRSRAPCPWTTSIASFRLSSRARPGLLAARSKHATRNSGAFTDLIKSSREALPGARSRTRALRPPAPPPLWEPGSAAPAAFAWRRGAYP
jgi:hypothetical protein